MRPCVECTREVSTDAKECPYCGKRKPTREWWMPTAPAGCLIIFFLLAIFGSLISTRSSHSPASAPHATARGEVHDDLTLLISRYGKPDRDENSENEVPRPSIVTRRLTYTKAHVRANYVPDTSVDASPPYRNWTFVSFQDSRTNAVLSAQEVDGRLTARKK
jgi:hypothetical protein